MKWFSLCFLRLLLGCFQDSAYTSNEAEMEVPIVNITTPFPPLTDVDIPAEDYPDYVLPNDDYMMKLRDVLNCASQPDHEFVIVLF